MEHALTALRALPWFIPAILLEAAYLVWIRREVYGWKEAACTVGVAAMGRLFNFFAAAVPLTVLQWVYAHRLLDLSPDTPWEWLALFVAVDFFYYWFHRLSHGCRWFWASHLVHHSPKVLRLSVAYRLGWTAGITGGFIFLLPIVWLGVEPKAVGILFGINLLYQFWLHTELIGKLGPVEWILNTPSQHRVHHATNEKYLDKNFGGVFCVFDRLFGTYQAEEERPVYGLVHAPNSYNPVKVSLWGWIELAHAWKQAGTWKERLKLTFSPPRDPVYREKVPTERTFSNSQARALPR